MKQRSLLVWSLCCLTLPVHLEAQELPDEQEQKAIRQVVDNETIYFYARDFKNWASCWSHQADVYFSATSRENYTIKKGWEAVSDNMKLYFQNNPDPHHPPIERSNFAYHIQGNLAWVYYDNREGNSYGKQQRVLRKENGQWKIINMTTIDEGSYQESGYFKRLLLFTFKPEATTAQLAKIKKEYRKMVDQIDGMNEATWMVAPETASPFSHAVLLQFNSEAALRAFEAHSDQSRISRLCEPILISRETNDYRLD